MCDIATIPTNIVVHTYDSTFDIKGSSLVVENTGMSQVYSIRLAHPKTQLPDSEFHHMSFLREPWADDIMTIHMRSGNMASRIICPEHWDDKTPWYAILIDTEDMSDTYVDGFNMVDFWFNRNLKDFTYGWTRWYVYVSRSTATGWTMTLLLDGEGKTREDVNETSRNLWLTYKEYFSSRLLHNMSYGQPSYGQPSYGERDYEKYRDARERDYEKLKDKLMFVSTEEERGDLGSLIDNRMTAMPRMGEVYRTDRHAGDCLLWCTTNDNCDKKRKTSTVRLWYP